MKLGSSRSLEELRKVLKDPSSDGPDIVYWVFSDLTVNHWANLTIITPGDFNSELPKTFGHYNTTAIDELYHIVAGEGILLLQKKTDTENEVSEVLLIKAKPGDEIIIRPEYGHSWSNAGDVPLISFDDWRQGHSPRDYGAIAKLHGMAYYLIRDGGEVRAVPNPNYQKIPEPIWMGPEEYRKRS